LVGGSNPPSATSPSTPDPMAALAARMAAACARLGVGDGIPLVLAVSGGADSMALLHLASALGPMRGWRLHVAHLDHALRDGSADDANFVADAAAALDAQAHLRRTDVEALARERGDGLEEAGRAARYAFLRDVARDVGTDAVVMTAHTADDQAETMLLNLSRGAGLAGLSGIAERAGDIVRPLLTIRRRELRDALDAAGIAYRDDPTNRSEQFARNRARSELIPLLERLHPGAVEALARAATLASADDQLLDEIASTELAKRRSADGWIDWIGPPPPQLAARVLRLAIGAPPVNAERLSAILDAARARRGGRAIELGAGRTALLRGHRVRIVHQA
jgi:tRNA(Ile)-lysidine synthetase-like protein